MRPNYRRQVSGQPGIRSLQSGRPLPTSCPPKAARPARPFPGSVRAYSRPSVISDGITSVISIASPGRQREIGEKEGSAGT